MMGSRGLTRPARRLLLGVRRSPGRSVGPSESHHRSALSPCSPRLLAGNRARTGFATPSSAHPSPPAGSLVHTCRSPNVSPPAR